MAKTATVRARIEPELKLKAEKVLSKLGLSQTEAITLFYQQVAMNRGLPFEVKIPNKQTLQAMAEVEAGIGEGPFKNADELFRAMRRR